MCFNLSVVHDKMFVKEDPHTVNMLPYMEMTTYSITAHVSHMVVVPCAYEGQYVIKQNNVSSSNRVY